ncbi:MULTISPECIES: MerR family transcriptional regulator [Rufibacter]|uniref:DNA-binding transcriptional MerR regulator n=1 Tax=Rufibacter quisquiliarum TaxID=1549639 RepID=A0A839GPB4_9BACT|nr:MerR family transcriptional regulator [Rufibacter ruber]MBA9076288.1 DNA-binding transcriptional MerR regulator [Rufibacter quisquiliarum]
MAHYSIKELEHLSGIKAHTLRIWEQRYQLLQPKRTATNIRYYDDADLKNLLNVALLYQEGYKISKIAQLPPTQVAEEVLKLTENELGQEQFINQLIVAMVELNEVLFERVLSRAILQLGFQQSVRLVVYPFLSKIGLLWQTANITPAHEHFMSQLIRQKMLVAIDALPVQQDKSAPRIVLYLPEGELHEVALLFGHYLFRSAGFSTLYLGQHLPFCDLLGAVKQFKPDYVFSVFTTPVFKVPISEYLEELVEKTTLRQVLVCGAMLQYFPADALPEKVTCFKSIDEMEQWLQCHTAEEAAKK